MVTRSGAGQGDRFGGIVSLARADELRIYTLRPQWSGRFRGRLFQET